MLTDTEKHACRMASFRKGLGHGYGSPAEGYCPIGAVAVLRGAVMEINLDLDGEYEYTSLQVSRITPDGFVMYTVGPCHEIVAQAEKDVLAWTGHHDIRSYLAALEGSEPGTIPWVED